MKNIFFILFSIFSFQGFAQTEKPTIIYLVRHAEKVTTDPSAKDPLLTEMGQKRAVALSKKLRKQKLSAIYSTDFQRTKLTAMPIAEKNNLQVKIYNTKNLKDWAKQVLVEHTGQKVLVLGHSNSTLEAIEALGGKKPFIAITEQEYDYFFTVTIASSGTVDVSVSHYGAKNSNVEGVQMMQGK